LDVALGGPAETGGLQPKDIVFSVDGTPVFNLPSFSTAIATNHQVQPLRMEAPRGAGRLASIISAKLDRVRESDQGLLMLKRERRMQYLEFEIP
jgi:S1-C subfamily serine protease